jgi:adenylylsulfate kinase
MITPITIWITGLPCSGKTTLAAALSAELRASRSIVVLDGDTLRKTLCSDLGYSEIDRREHTRRLGSICLVLNNQGVTTIVAAISPTIKLRKFARALVGERFFEVFISCPLPVCISRDTKGMYKKALAGEIKDFTGISAPYQEPTAPELVLDSSKLSLVDEVAAVLGKISV